MSKTRFSTTDVKCLVRDIRSLALGKRVANVYDLSEKCYLLKFAVPGTSEKTMLLLESGIRFHTTKYAREMTDLPSPFAMKLRKHIRTKRLEDVRQLGEDRVVDFKFGSGDSINHIILELYASGNIVLTDANYQVLALLRSHQFAEDVKLSVGEIYPLVFATNIENLTTTQSTITPTEDTVDSSIIGVIGMNLEQFYAWIISKSIDLGVEKDSEPTETPADTAGTKKNKKAQKQLTLRQLLLSQDGGVSHYGPEVLDHCALKAGLKSNAKVDSLLKLDISGFEKLKVELQSAEKVITEMNKPGHQVGYIILKDQPVVKPALKSTTPGTADQPTDNSTTAAVAPETAEVVAPVVEFVEFVPFWLAQHEGKPYLEFSSFNEAADEYFSKIEDQKLQRGANSAEEAARKKIEKVKGEQEKMLRGLEQQQERMQKSAMLLELHAEDVDKVCLVINSALGSGMTWQDIDEMVTAEKKSGNPIASLVAKLRLDRNHVVLRLHNPYANSSADVDAAGNDSGDDSDDADEPPAETSETVAIVPAIVAKPTAPVAPKPAFNMFDSDSENEEDSATPTAAPVAAVAMAAVAAAPPPNKATEHKPPPLQHVNQIVTKKAKSNAPNNKPNNQSNTGKHAGKEAAKEDLYLEVEIDLSLSAHANARNMYANKKSARVKELKTVDISAKVLQTVEAQTMKALESQKIKRNLLATRKVHWFEKFNWFITSEGYLVLSGRDAQQNELLFKRYLKKGDVYVHADLSGASSCIVKAKIPAKTGTDVTATDSADPSAVKSISPLAIQEAGIMAVCRSQAWNAKVMTSAWWVWASQVSKTAPSGEYLTTGSFMIYGKKNFLPPMALEMGFGIMFRLDDASVGRHLNDRKDRAYLSDMESVSVLTDNFDRYNLEMQVSELTGNLVEGIPEEQGEENIDNDEMVAPAEFEENEGANDTAQQQHQQQQEEGEEYILSDSDADNSSNNSGNNDSNSNSDVDNSDAECNNKQLQNKLSKKNIDTNNNNNNISNNTAKKESTECALKRAIASAAEASTGHSIIESNIKRNVAKGASMQNSRRQLEPQQPQLQQNSELPNSAVDGSNNNNNNVSISSKGDKQNKNEKVNKNQKINKKFGSNSDSNHDKNKQNNKHTNKDTNSKGNNKNGAVDTADDEADTQSVTPSVQARKAKVLNKKKARRYAEQDEEDRELAMLILGHTAKDGEKLNDKLVKTQQEKQQKSLKTRQEKAGIRFVKDDWNSLMNLLTPTVRTAVQEIVDQGGLKDGEIDAYEMKTLASFPEEHGLEILTLLQDGKNLLKVGNKSGFLAGIMRRFAKDLDKKTLSVVKSAPIGSDNNTINNNNIADNSNSGDSSAQKIDNNAANNSDNDGALDDTADLAEAEDLVDGAVSNEKDFSRRERKKAEQREIQDILAEEGMLDEVEGKQADELFKLTGCPVPEDKLLYAIPVCGPYMSMQNFKYKVKLTPGTAKKGKAAKQALEVFTRAKECPATEKTLMKGLSDPEMVAIMIGEVKLSTPGLYQKAQQGNKAKKSRGQKK